jgi:hypothetical protein
MPTRSRLTSRQLPNRRFCRLDFEGRPLEGSAPDSRRLVPRIA